MRHYRLFDNSDSATALRGLDCNAVSTRDGTHSKQTHSPSRDHLGFSYRLNKPRYQNSALQESSCLHADLKHNDCLVGDGLDGYARLILQRTPKNFSYQ